MRSLKLVECEKKVRSSLSEEHNCSMVKSPYTENGLKLSSCGLPAGGYVGEESLR
jgi:hypothetical protein